jgi:hypothetical protein
VKLEFIFLYWDIFSRYSNSCLLMKQIDFMNIDRILNKKRFRKAKTNSFFPYFNFILSFLTISSSIIARKSRIKGQYLSINHFEDLPKIVNRWNVIFHHKSAYWSSSFVHPAWTSWIQGYFRYILDYWSRNPMISYHW